MKIIKTKDYAEMSKKAFDVIKEVLDENKEAVINTTVGASYDGVFELMVDAINNNELTIDDSIFMNLDEYIAERNRKVHGVHIYV